ncbi:uncharacterized protein LOC124121878 [Haliotis rufescens]|uniref:uncharacterized protein LOC124121878 n=1 Tax=Haliotis rufescens TaxID=6454 RepID=UPI00201EB742|nr:uncharacterized protein LOC124121878 [Haliotis rufescens]
MNTLLILMSCLTLQTATSTSTTGVANSDATEVTLTSETATTMTNSQPTDSNDQVKDYSKVTTSSAAASAATAATHPEDPPYTVLGFTDRNVYNYIMFGTTCGSMFILVSTACICAACQQAKQRRPVK